MQVKLSDDQRIALTTLVKWSMNAGVNDYITLGGYAGTGKTTLIALLRKLLMKEEIKTKVAFCSYTGKGALVLKTKLNNISAIYKKDSVGTIHSLIYEPVVNGNSEITGWKMKEKVDADLLIIDEASMVDSQIWSDLRSFRIPIIAVGDHGQLPPINGSFNLMQKPDLMLNSIHRQAAENPIIQLSIEARQKGAIEIKEYASTVKKYSRADETIFEKIEELLSDYTNDLLVLCGYNNTRVKLNHQIRSHLGFFDAEPQIGDKVICLRNNHSKGIYNGMFGEVQYIEVDSEDWYFTTIEMENGMIYEGLIYKPQFSSPESINYTKDRKKLGSNDIFDFGYAITVHKAQGSEAGKVLLFEERFSKMDDEMWRRWLYTAVTRAKEELYIIGD